ncbi:MAG: MGMT family protein [Deltaproteobacteria bacterium]|nr:MGMT family protein [Deltaproteobacteria bacterium]
MVSTYGRIARVAARPGAARLVGRALQALPDADGVPWHRVIGANGRIADLPAFGAREVQRELLRSEGCR